MSKRKLLLADDSETVQKVVNLTFDLEGIEVITFGDGDSAMAQFAAVAPDVVLADVNMPGLSGYEICRSIKSNAATKHIPVILLVGSFEPFDEEKSMQVGADDYLTKPFQSIRQLVAKVNELLSPAEGKDFDEFEFNKTLEMEKKPFSEPDFGDPGMDDEMIQTSHIGNSEASETPNYESADDYQSEAQSVDQSATQPLSQSDWREIQSPESEAEENSEQTVYELADDQDDMPISLQHSEEPAPPIEKIEDPVAESAEFDSSVEADYEAFESEDTSREPETLKEENDFGIQPDDIDHFYEEPDYEEEESVEIPVFAGDNQETRYAPENQQDGETESGFEIINNDLPEAQEIVSAPEAPQSEEEPVAAQKIDENESATENESVAETESSAENKSSAENESAAEMPFVQKQTFSTAHDLNFDDFDLLEDSFSEKADARFAAPVDNMEEPEPQNEAAEENMENGSEQIKSEVSEQLSGVNLSQADIDAIAEKVVEKLTARMKE